MNLCKLLFYLDASDWHARSQETVWADLISESDGKTILRVQNSPFFAKSISFLDLVKGHRTDNDLFVFDQVVERSGHSTYVILCPIEQTAFEELWRPLESAGCTYESGEIEISMGKMRMFSVDIPPGKDLLSIYSLLQDGENKGVWIFQESHYCRTGMH